MRISLIFFWLLSFSVMAETEVTTTYESKLRPTPCSSSYLIDVPKDQRIIAIDKKMVWSSALGTYWYQVQYKGKTGWISDQNTDKYSQPKFDRSRMGRGCNY